MLFHSLRCSRISIRTSLLSFPVCTFLCSLGVAHQFRLCSLHITRGICILPYRLSNANNRQQLTLSIRWGQTGANARYSCLFQRALKLVWNTIFIFFIQFTYLSALALILFTHPHHRVVWMSLLCSKCCNYFLQKEGQWKKKCTIPQGYNICSEKHIQ